MILLPLVLVSVSAVVDAQHHEIRKGGASCSSAQDCSMTGTCTAGRCRCDPAWTGPSCEHLHLLPALQQALYPRGGHPTSLPSSRSFPWGGTIAKEVGQDKYHLFVAEWANHCPMTYATWPAQVNVRHATATTPNGPWTPKEVVLTALAIQYTLGHPTVRTCSTSLGCHSRSVVVLRSATAASARTAHRLCGQATSALATANAARTARSIAVATVSTLHTAAASMARGLLPWTSLCRA
jgi:hypothetical protein